MCYNPRLFRLNPCGSVLFFFRCVVDDFYFWYSVEGVVISHEVTDSLAEVTDLDAYIPQEVTDCPTSDDHDCFWVHFSQIWFYGKP